MSDVGEAIGVILILIGIFSLILGLGIYGYSALVTVGFQYQAAVHSHMQNAYYSADPDTMLVEINAAKDGMKSLGLSTDMYGAWLPWRKTPDNRMDWQYTHLASVVTRIGEFKAWENSQTNVGSQQMQDVYTAKLNNVRDFIAKDGGWSDDIAEQAFFVNYHFFEMVISFIGAFIGLGLFMLGVFIYHGE